MTIDYTLYLVTDAPARYARPWLDEVAAAIAGGASVVQYRATTGTKRELYEAATTLHALTRRHGVPLIINDHVDLALAVNAEGVHLGQNDLPTDIARRLIGRDRVLGLSITAPEQLDDFSPADVDYLGIGPIFPTSSKIDASPAVGLLALGNMVRHAPRPVVAIGGISEERAPQVFATGVAGIAVVAALSQATDPRAAAQRLRAAARLQDAGSGIRDPRSQPPDPRS